MKVYIVGTGGVGGFFGGLLAKAGKDVTFVARGENFQAIKNSGLRINGTAGSVLIKPAKVVEKITEIKNPELIFFTVKTYQTASAAAELARVVSGNTVIITFQNGVDNDNEIKKFVKNAGVYPGVAYLISTKIKPGVIEQIGGLKRLITGDRINPVNQQLKKAVEFIESTGINIELSEDITRDLWKKFIFICASAGMTGICRSPMGKILADPQTRQLFERCAREAIATAKAMNVKVPTDAFETLMKTALSTNPNSKTSLLVDIEKGRKNEIETLNGGLVRFAREKKVDVPLNELIYGAISLINK